MQHRRGSNRLTETQLNASQSRTLSAGESETVSVDSRLHWNHSGIKAFQLEEYEISVPQGQTWSDAGIVCGAAGQSGNWFQSLFPWSKRVASAPWFALIATTDMQLTTPFVYAGAAANQFMIEIDGEILMFANDAWIAYGNNSGAIKVLIKRIK